jgi:hypothetical protein
VGSRGSEMTLRTFHRRLAALSRGASSKQPIREILEDYVALEESALRNGVASLTKLQVRRWIAEQAIIVAQLRTEPFAVVGPLMLRNLALGFASPYDKYVAVNLFADYCRRVGGEMLGEHCLLAALSDVESDPRFEMRWQANVEGTLPEGTRKSRIGGRSSWHQLLDLAGQKRSAGGRSRSRRGSP